MDAIEIFDVYGYLHAGMNVPSLAGRSKRSLPVGGVLYLLRKVCAELALDNKVVCAFDSNGGSISNRRLDGYKSNRHRDPAIAVQADFLYNFLQKCGIPCYRGACEADDIIYSICEQYYPTLNFNTIVINGTDYDLCHNVIMDVYGQKSVVFKAANSLCCNVEFINFSSVLFDRKTGYKIPYNTISAYKVFCGDKSDNIKPFKTIDGRTGLALYKEFVEEVINDDNVPNDGRITRDRSLVDFYINNFVKYESDRDKLMKRASTIFPKDVSHMFDGGFRLASKATINKQLLANYCKALGDRDSLKSLRMLNVIGQDNENIDEEIFGFGKDYSNGAYSTDNNMPLRNPNICKSEPIMLIRDF